MGEGAEGDLICVIVRRQQNWEDAVYIKELILDIFLTDRKLSPVKRRSF
jgi:hypothetical protein